MCAHTHTDVRAHTQQTAERGDKGREGGLQCGRDATPWGNGGGVGGNERESRDAERKMENIESGEVKEETEGEREKEQKRGS